MNPSIERWITEFFATIDRMEADGFAGYFAGDGTFRFANQSPLVGSDAIAAGAGAIFGMLTAIRHDLIKHWLADGELLVEGVVHYHRAADGRDFAFPFLSVFEFESEIPGAIQAYRVFVDSHELFLPPSA
jgi:ketosteroid isomerase-like protein